MLDTIKAYSMAIMAGLIVLGCLTVYAWGQHQRSLGVREGKEEVTVAVQAATIAETQRQLRANRQAAEQSAARITQLQADNAELAANLKVADEAADNDTDRDLLCLDAGSIQLHNGLLGHRPEARTDKP